MPSYHIWIRKEDEAKWKAIENKPEWLHVHLNAAPILITKPKLQVKRLVDESTLYVKTKCDICGDYHFAYDSHYACNKKPIEPTITEPEDVA